MKTKILFIIELILILCSCDPLFHDDFIIVNECNDNITVEIEDYNQNRDTFNLYANQDTIFYFNEWAGGYSQIEYISKLFSSIRIKKNNIYSQINYNNYQLWVKENIESSKHNAYYTRVRYYLYIKPEDFE
ncbi:MAG: hypothetical protein LBN95_01880 [Prevotellaceae bacterium]|jgi:hypothetical protein|nr:hypothetical protein [Prevotellaceae bacterium]